MLNSPGEVCEKNLQHNTFLPHTQCFIVFILSQRGPSLDTHQRLRLLHHCEHLFDYKPVKTSFCVLASCECLVSKVTVVFVCQYIGILAETN